MKRKKLDKRFLKQLQGARRIATYGMTAVYKLNDKFYVVDVVAQDAEKDDKKSQVARFDYYLVGEEEDISSASRLAAATDQEKA